MRQQLLREIEWRCRPKCQQSCAKKPETERITHHLKCVVPADHKNLTTETIVKMVAFRFRSMHNTACACHLRTITGLLSMPPCHSCAFLQRRWKCSCQHYEVSPVYSSRGSRLVSKRTFLSSWLSAYRLPFEIERTLLRVIFRQLLSHLLDLHKHFVYKSPFMVMDWKC